jgi:hypothetical protein
MEVIVVPDRKPGATRLDEPDFPAYTTGQAALLLDVPPSFLRGLDAVGAVVPGPLTRRAPPL